MQFGQTYHLHLANKAFAIFKSTYLSIQDLSKQRRVQDLFKQRRLQDLSKQRRVQDLSKQRHRS